METFPILKPKGDVLQFTEAVVNLKFDEEPKYAAYSALFEPLCGSAASRPVLQTDTPKVSHQTLT